MPAVHYGDHAVARARLLVQKVAQAVAMYGQVRRQLRMLMRCHVSVYAP